MNDLISRQAAIDALMKLIEARLEWKSDASREINGLNAAYCAIEDLPSAEPTLYGYKIEHLAYIARVMEKEGITAEDAARTFSDLGRAVFWIIDEALQKMEEAIHDHNTGSI